MHKENKNNFFFNNFSPHSVCSGVPPLWRVSRCMRWFPAHVNNACAWYRCLCYSHMHKPAYALCTWTGSVRIHCDTVSVMAVHCYRRDEERNCWKKVGLFLFSLCTKSILCKLQLNPMSHGLFFRCPSCVSGNISVALLSMKGLRALGFNTKYLNLCSEDERRSYWFGTTRE